MTEENNFSRVASTYDYLSKFIFGSATKKSQLEYLSRIMPNSSVLILGGGTGWILDELNSFNIAMTVTYVEPSLGMMKRSKSRECKNIRVIFRKEKPVEDDRFDHVLAFYFFDLFSELNLIREITKVRNYLKPDGCLHFADFELSNGPNRIWQGALSKVMHLFFRLASGLESRKLLPIHNRIVESGFTKNEERFFYGRFICSRIYCRA